MIKPFFVLVALLMISVATVSTHYLYYEDTSQKMVQQISSVTQLSSLSLSVAYYEPRILFDEEVDNPAYPQMIPLNRMDVVYAK